MAFHVKKVREKSRECHNHKTQPFPDPKRKRKPTNLNKHKPNKRTKSTKISSLFPKRGNRNTKRTEKHKNKMTHGKTYNKSPRRINHKATKVCSPLNRQLQQLLFALSSACDFKSHFCKQCGPRSVWSGSRLFACMKKIGLKSLQGFSRRHKQTTFSDAGFLGVFLKGLTLWKHIVWCSQRCLRQAISLSTHCYNTEQTKIIAQLYNGT